MRLLKSSTKLFADETRCPVLDPGRGKTKTGYLWAIARDDRPWASADPPAVAYLYAPGRGAEHAVRHLAGFSGVLQVDGYAGYNVLTDDEAPRRPADARPLLSHFRRRFYDIAKGGNAPIATEALARIGKLYEIEADIRGRTAAGAPRGAPGSDQAARRRAEAMARAATRLRLRTLDDRRGHPLRPQPLGGPQPLPRRRPHRDRHQYRRALHPADLRSDKQERLFAGSDEGGANWAIIASLIETAKFNGVNPHAWLTDTLTKLVNRWPATRIDELMPWAYGKENAVKV